MPSAKAPKNAKNRREQNFAPADFEFHSREISFPQNFVFPKFKLRSDSFTKVTAPSEAEETSEAYLENTPRL
jgi:hypothetical protein